MEKEEQTAASSNPSTMRLLKIKTLDNKLFEIKADSTMLVKDLKIKVEEVSGVPRDRQRMICMGQQLQDQNTVGQYAKEEQTWIHLVAKVPQPEQPSIPSQPSVPSQPQTQSQQQPQQAPHQQPAAAQQGAPRRPLDLFGNGVQIQSANIGDISSLLGNITNVLGSLRNGQNATQPNLFPQSTANVSAGQAPSNTTSVPQPSVPLRTANVTQPPTNLTQGQQPITISRQIQLPHQEVFNLGQICNQLMGQQSTFPGPPLPQIPNRNPAQLVGSYLSNWECQVQRTLPFVHRLAELLQREPYMQLVEDRASTMGLSAEVGRALNEIVLSTSPMVSVLRDLVLLPTPGQIRFEQNHAVTQPVQSIPPRPTFQSPLQQPQPVQPANLQGPVTQPNQPTQPQEERNQPNPANENPLNNLLNNLNLGNGQNGLHIVVDQQDGDASQEIRVLGFSNQGDEDNNGINLQSVLQNLMQSVGAQSAAAVTINASTIPLNSVPQNIPQQGTGQNAQNTNAAQGSSQSNVQNPQINGMFQQLLSGLSSNSTVINGHQAASVIQAANNNRSNVNQSSNPIQLPNVQSQPQNLSSQPAQQQQNQPSQANQNQQQPVQEQQQQPQVGNPLAMLMGGGLMGNIMTMTVDELIRDNMTEEDTTSETEQVVLNIIGSLRIMDIISSTVSGQFSFLDLVQEKMRNAIRTYGLNREQFSDKMATQISNIMQVPEQLRDRLYEGIEPEGIAYDILDETLPEIYDIVFRDYPQNGLERFSNEFMHEFRKIVGRLFSELSECFQNGLTDMEVVFRYTVNEQVTRILGENAAIVNALVPSMLWDKIKREVLTYQHEEEQRRQPSQPVQQQVPQQGQGETEAVQPPRQDQEIDLLEDIENGLERDQERFGRYQNIEFSEEYKKGDLTQKKK